VLHVCMEYANDRSIPKWMCVWSNFWRGHHNERMCARIDSVVVTAHVIGGVINAGSTSSKNGIVDDADGVTVIIGEGIMGVAVEISTKPSA